MTRSFAQDLQAPREGIPFAHTGVMEPRNPQVVVAYDFSPTAHAVLDRAVALVSRAPFHVLHFITVLDAHGGIAALPHHGKVDIDYADKVRDLMMVAIADAFGGSALEGKLHVFAHVRIGKPGDEILGLAQEIGADLILIGTHGHTGLTRLVMGSVAERVVREAGCPVLVARPKTYPDIELVQVIEVQHATGHGPRRFSYENNVMTLRPLGWPM